MQYLNEIFQKNNFWGNVDDLHITEDYIQEETS